MNRAQKAWCKQYEQSTTFEPLMDDFLAGNETFAQAAKKSRDWFENWMIDAFHGIPDTPPNKSAPVEWHDDRPDGRPDLHAGTQPGDLDTFGRPLRPGT